MSLLSDNQFSGVIVRATGGFYYVLSEDIVYECKARGVFRKNGCSPVVGDNVSGTLKSDGYHSIDTVLPRKNLLTRPPLANLDNIVIVVSSVEPEPNTLVIDKLAAAAVSLDIMPVFVFSKTDIGECGRLYDVYSAAGFECVMYHDGSDDGLERIRSLFFGSITALIGNSGVGKSTLLNNLFPKLELSTGEISRKLGRGRHTTRTVELYSVGGGLVADTPGFSTVDLVRYELSDKSQLMYCFPEFTKYIGSCRFASCTHVCEDGCKIIAAVNDGEISRSRHNSYVQMYEEIKDIKQWQLKDNKNNGGFN